MPQARTVKTAATKSVGLRISVPFDRRLSRPKSLPDRSSAAAVLRTSKPEIAQHGRLATAEDARREAATDLKFGTAQAVAEAEERRAGTN